MLQSNAIQQKGDTNAMMIQRNGSTFTANQTPPIKNPYALNPFAEWVTRQYDSFKTIPTRGANLVDTFHADARQAKNPIVSSSKQLIGNIMGAVTADVEFKNFEKTPELFGVNLPRLPLTLSLAMFFGSMVPARIHSEYLRAPEVDDDGDGIPDRKDYRAIGDVAIRDLASISLFLLAFEPVKDAILRKKQRDGAIFSFGNTHNPRMMIATSGFSPRPVAHPLAYNKLEELYSLDSPSPESFAHLVVHDKSNDVLHQTIRKRLQSVGLWNHNYSSLKHDLSTPQGREAAFLQQAQSRFKASGDRLATDVQGVTTEKLKLKARLRESLQESNPAMMDTLGSSADVMTKRLFEMDALSNHQTLEATTHTSLLNELKSQQATLKASLLQGAFHPEAKNPHAFQPLIANLPEHIEFTKAMDAALHHGDLEQYNLLCDKAKNASNHIDTLVKVVLLHSPKDKDGNALNYQQVFKQIKQGQFAQLEEGIARYRAGENLVTALSHPSHGEASVNRVKSMFANSKQAMHSMKTLDKTVKEIQTSKGSEYLNASVTLSDKRYELPLFDTIADKLKLGSFKRFRANDILTEATKAMRSPSDFTSFMFVAGVIGLFPVWLIQVITETEYRLRKGHSHRKLDQLEATPEDVATPKPSLHTQPSSPLEAKKTASR
jgi:hypothetical protein